MRFSILASGSLGNSFFVESSKERILIDIGLSLKEIEKRLLNLKIPPNTITKILLTHENVDHIKGLHSFTKKYNVPVYLNKHTYENLPKSLKKIPENLVNFFETSREFNLNDINIQPIPVSHDAADPVGFKLTSKNNTISIVTDLGYVNNNIKDILKGSKVLIMESNHDTNMLKMCKYPWEVKRRILSDKGHLSNEDTGYALAEIIRGEKELIYLAHLSQENNIFELAFLTIKNILSESGLVI